MRLMLIVLLFGLTAQASAKTFRLPGGDNDLIGHLVVMRTRASNTLSGLARRNDVGYNSIRRANPGVDPWLPGSGTRIRIPEWHILPDAPHRGIVVNLAEYRLYYYPPGKQDGHRVVQVYPVGIGRVVAPTPVATTEIVERLAHPAWYPPPSIRKEHAADHNPLPPVVAAGPNNPLGQYALKLALPGYFMHGTNKPYGIGMRVSHGCIRLYPKDIDKLFKEVTVGTPVHIVDQPYKAGWYDGRLYFEARPPLAGTNDKPNDLTPAIHAVLVATRGHNVRINWNKVTMTAIAAHGIPVQVSD